MLIASRRVLVGLTLASLLTAARASAQLPQLHATLVASGLTAPVGFIQDPSDPTVQMVIEQTGRVRVLKNGVVQSNDFLNISASLPASNVSDLGERGLLGFAFAPDYATSGRVFVSFTNAAGNSVIARFTRSSGNPLQADASTRVDLVWPGGNAYIAQPFSNHNGGNIAFGPDGYLYIGFGDGGSGNDPNHNAQNPMSLLGKMLRIDVSGDSPHGYTIPPTNPFAGRADVLQEIWAFGLRNPWRWSFDAQRAGSTGALVIGDVGQDAWEEIDYEPMNAGGRNYGWGNREASHTNGNYTGGAPPAVAPTPLRDPLFEYSHSTGHSITGGYVYRGRLLPASYRGRYFFADYANSRVWSLGLTINPSTGEATAGSVVEHTSDLGGAATSVTSFGVDAAGELYTVSYAGAIYRIDVSSGSPPDGCSASDPYLASGGGLCTNGVWRPRTAGSDFNGDGRPDLIFTSTTQDAYAWFLDRHTFVGGAWLTPSQLAAGWRVAATGDLTGDNRPDLILQHQTSGAFAVWTMNGTTKVSEQAMAVAPNSPWRIMATADVNADGAPDIVWQNVTSGEVFFWFMSASGGIASPIGFGYAENASHVTQTVGGTWKIAGAGDIDGDGCADLIWEDAAGHLMIWYMRGTTVSAQSTFSSPSVNAAWQLRAVADLNGDQHPDLIWENAATNDLYVWYLVGSRMARGDYVNPSRVNLIWQIAGPK
jgi:glucose/arabinose dehydrogenase